MRSCTAFIAFLSLISHLFTSIAVSRDVNFDDVFVKNTYSSETSVIPKVAHLVFTKVRPLVWLEFAAIKSATINLEVETVNIWCPPSAVFEDSIWQLFLSFPQVRLRKVEMPTSICGHHIEIQAHVSDVLRLEALYAEGGIYMDYNIIALRSSNPIIYDSSTKSAVMAEQGSNQLGNAFFMAKQYSPFLKAWMQEYKHFDDADWGGLSLVAPHRLYEQGNQDLTVLDAHTWYYPTCCSNASTIKLFFGHSFTDIDDNYGVHQWGGKWRTTNMLTPESVRTIDTPFFCRIRHLFNDIGDEYEAQDYRTNPNCSFVNMSALEPSWALLMADYQFTHDTEIKIIDASGNRLHGWAPHGTGLPLDAFPSSSPTKPIIQQIREFRSLQFAVLPLPIDLDLRTGTIQTSLLLQNGFLDAHDWTTTLFQIRTDDDSKLFLRLLRSGTTGNTSVQVEWTAGGTAPQHNGVAFTHTSTRTVNLDDGKWHTLQLSWDRRDAGLITVHVDADGAGDRVPQPLLAANIRLLPGKVKPGDVWINALTEVELDMGLRARMRFLRTYAAAHLASWVDGDDGRGQSTRLRAASLDPSFLWVKVKSLNVVTVLGMSAIFALLCVSVGSRRYGRMRREWRKTRLLFPGSGSVLPVSRLWAGKRGFSE